MAHLQPEDCYVAHQIGVLIPKKEMTLVEKLCYIKAISAYRALVVKLGKTLNGKK